MMFTALNHIITNTVKYSIQFTNKIRRPL